MMKPVRRNPSSAHVLTLKTVALAAAIGVSSMAWAAENGGQRYSPGIGGSDMTSPLVPGWYGQMAMVAYHATKIKGNDGQQLAKTGNITSAQIGAAVTALGGDGAAAAGAFPGGINYNSKVGIKTDTYALQPRITYLSANQWLGGNIGVTAMLPLVRRKIQLAGEAPTLTPVGSTPLGAVPGLGAGLSSRVLGGIATDSSTYGIGDLEIAPLWHTEIGDHQSLSIAPTLILPTGDYDATQRANAGSGNFYTFRPSVQYAFIGDGWDVGGRLVFSFNTRNKENGYRSGNMLNFDYQVMKFVTEDVRVGLQGYTVQQLTGDSQDMTGIDSSLLNSADLTTGNKMRVHAAGPAVAWIKNGGEMLLEGKFLKEFGAKNRTEGQSFWLTLSKPL